MQFGVAGFNLSGLLGSYRATSIALQYIASVMWTNGFRLCLQSGLKGITVVFDTFIFRGCLSLMFNQVFSNHSVIFVSVQLIELVSAAAVRVV